MIKAIRPRLNILLAAALCSLPLLSAEAFDPEQSLRELHPHYDPSVASEYRVSQNGGMSLSEAIESVRRRTNGRIVSAETRVSNGREVHYVKVLTKDGKVKTHKVPGRSRGNG